MAQQQIPARAHCLPCGLEPTNHNTKYVNNPVCVLRAQSWRPYPGAASEPSVSPEQGAEVTNSVSGERCEGRVLGGTAGPPVGSAQTWVPRAEEEPAPVRQTGDTGEGKLISMSEESGGSLSIDIQLSQEFNFADDLFSHATKTQKTRAEKTSNTSTPVKPNREINSSKLSVMTLRYSIGKRGKNCVTR